MTSRSLIARYAERAALDRAVVYLLLTRSLQVAAGPISLLFISRFMTPEMQGFHYTFFSLIALQTFVELSLYQVIITLASHEWAHLGMNDQGQIIGSPDARSRLVSLGRLVFGWYSIAAVIFIGVVGFLGEAFLRSEATAQFISWRAPWWTLVVLSGAQLLALAFNALLEGCNQVGEVNKFRLWQAVAGPVALWTTLWLGGGLWAAVSTAVVIFARDLYLLLIRFRRFFEAFLVPAPASSIRWRSEVWPLQWRIGAQAAINYFMYSLFTPVIFRYHGAAEAGRMGMTWQVVTLVQSFGISWMVTNAPRFGMLAATGSRAELDERWSRLTRLSVAAVILLQACWLAAVIVLHWMKHPLSTRILGPVPTAIFLLASLPVVIVQCQAVYLRAHKVEPLAAIGVFSGLVAGLLIWQLGRVIGPTGAAAGYLGVYLFITAPAVTWIWRAKRRAWRDTAPVIRGAEPYTSVPQVETLI